MLRRLLCKIGVHSYGYRSWDGDKVVEAFCVSCNRWFGKGTEDKTAEEYYKFISEVRKDLSTL